MAVEKPQIYEVADGLRYELQQRYYDKREEFPHGQTNYVQAFKTIEEYLNEHVHREVLAGALLAGSGLLTDHGEEHVAMVIQRASLLLEHTIKDLSGFEVFILLLAIHFHDVGNISGREEHEKRVFDVMKDLEDRLPIDNPTKRLVAKIAGAHGGEINNSKDTIFELLMKDAIQGKSVRPTLIAAILRFADEIADDNTRACRYLMDSGKISERDAIFHRYSASLQPTTIEGNTLRFKYDLNVESACEPCGKNERGDVFLYDEILRRSKKCLCELEYCNRYMRPLVHLDTIRADVEVYHPKVLNAIYQEQIVLRLRAYPNITDINMDGNLAMDGAALQLKVSVKIKEIEDSKNDGKDTNTKRA